MEAAFCPGKLAGSTLPSSLILRNSRHWNRYYDPQTYSFNIEMDKNRQQATITRDELKS